MAPRPTNRKSTDTPRLVKFRLTAEEQDVIRLAAARSRTSMAAFARLAVLDKARQDTEDIQISTERPQVEMR